MQELLFSKQKVKRNVLFECWIISPEHWPNSLSVFWLGWSNFDFRFLQWNLWVFSSLIKNLEKVAQFLGEQPISFWEASTLSGSNNTDASSTRKKGTNCFQEVYFGSFVISYKSTLTLGLVNVKNVAIKEVPTSVLSTASSGNSGKWIQFERTGNLHLHSQKLLKISKICKLILLLV